MKSGVWSLSCLMRSVVLLTVLCSLAAADPATAPSSTQLSPKWVASPLVNLPPNVSSVTIPLRRAGNLLCAPVQIDGKEAGWFVIDTGSSNTLIDSSVAKRLGFKKESGVEISALIEDISTDLVRYQDLQIGQVNMRHGVADVVDLTPFSTHGNFPCAGVLGCDLLRELPVAIDFRSATLTFYSRNHFEPPVSSTFPLIFHSDAPSVQASIEGNSAPILIDTGTGRQVLELLLNHGAKVNGGPGLAGATLIAAASNNNLENVDFLLKNGADVNQSNPRGITPLMTAALKGHEPIVLKLLESGADPSLRSIEGKTAADLTNSTYVRSALMAASDARLTKSGR